MKLFWKLLCGLALAALAAIATIVGGITALIEALFGAGAMRWAESLSKDYREDPAYKRKLRELIERNKKFEEEQERRSNKTS
jgi:hypothetical protein